MHTLFLLKLPFNGVTLDYRHSVPTYSCWIFPFILQNLVPVVIFKKNCKKAPVLNRKWLLGMKMISCSKCYFSSSFILLVFISHHCLFTLRYLVLYLERNFAEVLSPSPFSNPHLSSLPRWKVSLFLLYRGESPPLFFEQHRKSFSFLLYQDGKVFCLLLERGGKQPLSFKARWNVTLLSFILGWKAPPLSFILR